MTTYEGPLEQVEAGVRPFRDEVVPWLRDAHGFRGWIFLLDREAERGLALTFWTTDEAARDVEQSGANLRDEVLASVKITMPSLDFYEVLAVESLAVEADS